MNTTGKQKLKQNLLVKWSVRAALALFFIVFLLAAGMLAAAKIAGPLEILPPDPAVFYDRHRQPIGKWQEGTRQWVPIEEIAPAVRQATLAVEDRRFFYHDGFDFRRIIGAAAADLRSLSKAQGASTITMQYARNLYLSNNKTWLRKTVEVFYTLRLEMHASKKEIFEGYLNTIYYGSGAYGIEAAAKTYFNKKAADLTLAEASMLAGIPKGPGLYSPLLDYDRARQRQKTVLNAMAEGGYITAEQAKTAYRMPLQFTKHHEKKQKTAPYFQDAVYRTLIEEMHLRPEDLATKGLNVYTTLDAKTQKAAEYWVAKMMPPSSDLQAALVAIDPRTGAVRAMVGGRNYEKSAFNRAISAKRAPGSAFKPFLYYAALMNGFTPSTMLQSKPTVFSYEHGRASYAPDNFGGHYADAPITMSQALALSDNIFAVKTHLAIGMEQMIKAARNAGIASPLAEIPSLALGSKPVTVLEMAGGYATLAGEGARIEPGLIDKVTDSRGRVLYERQPVKEQALNRQATFVLSQMMTGIFDKRLNGYTQVTGSPVADRLTHKMAAKTGSTESDSWMAGFTPELAAAVWIGYDKGETISTYPDTGYAKSIWAHFMESALEDAPDDSFNPPEGVVSVSVDPKTGLLANDRCPGRQTWFIEGTEPTSYCSGNGETQGEQRDRPEKENWFDRLLRWWRQNAN